jgi:hypothetical protein
MRCFDRRRCRTTATECSYWTTPRYVDAQVGFLRDVFDATGVVSTGRPAEIRIGDSIVMVGTDTERNLFPAFLYVYVDDADAAYRRALSDAFRRPIRVPAGGRRQSFRYSAK